MAVDQPIALQVGAIDPLSFLTHETDPGLGEELGIPAGDMPGKRSIIPAQCAFSSGIIFLSLLRVDLLVQFQKV